MDMRASIKWIIGMGLGLTFGLSLAPARAETVQVLSLGCGTGAPSPGSNALYVDTTGTLCTSTGGGGGGAVNLTQVGGATINIGQQVAAASLPVVLASNQPALPVGYAQGSTTAGELTLPAGCAVLSAAPNETTGTTQPLNCVPAGGGLRVSLFGANGISLDIGASAGSSTARPLGIGSFNTTPVACANANTCPAAENSVSELITDPEVQKATYAGTVNVSPASTGVFAQLCGSASKIIRVRSESFAGTAAVAGGAILVGTKTSTAASGGTSGGTLSSGPLDSASAAATATLTAWTAAPTAGTTTVSYESFGQPLPLIANAVPPTSTTFGRGSQAIVLRGATQCVSYSLASVVTATTVNELVSLTWTEE